MKKWMKTLFKLGGYCVAILLLVAALMVSVGKILEPTLNAHRNDFEKWISQVLSLSITVENIHFSWRHIEPELSFDDVRVLSEKTHQPVFNIQHITINFNLFSSLLTRQLQLNYVGITGSAITLRGDITQKITVEGVGQFAVTGASTTQGVEANAVLTWIFSQPHLALDQIDIHYFPVQGESRFITLHHFELMNAKNGHALKGFVLLHQAIPTSLEVGLNWSGDITQWPSISAQLYLSMENVSLSQWIAQTQWQHLQIKRGWGSAKIWANWDHGQWHNIKTQWKVYDLRLYSLATHVTRFFPQLSGDFTWTHAEHDPVLTGNAISIDYQNHPWPSTSFSMTFRPDEQHIPHVESFYIEYLDIADAKDFAFFTGLVPPALRKPLTDLNPIGDLRAVSMHFSNSMDALSQNIFSAKVSNLALRPHDQIPGMTGVSGSVSWDGKTGQVDIRTQQAQLIYPILFSNPLSFDQVSGSLQIQKTETTPWVFTVKKLELQNADLALQVDMDISIPTTGSPTVNLSSDFSVKQAKEITHYLPLALFNKDLVTWLRQAFLSGEVKSGKAILQGKLSEFPFDDRQTMGKFSITGDVQHVNFQYAPDWPLIQDAKGELNFSGRSLSVNLVSAKLTDIPLSNIQGHIADLSGVQPLLLTVNGKIDSDFSHGMQFIQRSPLQKTIGDNMKAMVLKGAMQLQLGLSIPLKTPEKTSVNGDIAFTQGDMQFPEWNILLEGFGGSLHFTENTLQSTVLIGHIHNEPATLQISTEQNEKSPPVIRAVLESDTTLPYLQQKFKIPDISAFVQGKLHYQASVFIFPQHNQANYLSVHSDLKGVTVNVFDQYSKTADVSRDFQFDMLLKAKPLLQVKCRYADLLSAALTFRSSPQGFEWFGGLVNIGSLPVQWQSQPGLFLKGQFDAFDLETWKQRFLNLYERYQKSTSLKMTPVSDASLPHFEMLDFLKSVELTASKATLWGQVLNHFNFKASAPAEDAWSIDIGSNEIQGHLEVPLHTKMQPIQARFERFYLAGGEGSSVTLDPKALPALRFQGQDVRYNNIPIGNVSLYVMPTARGLSIQSLQVSSELLNLAASGAWNSTPTALTHLEGQLKTRSFARLSAQWGMPLTNLDDTGGTAAFDFQWAGAPYQMSVNDLSGDLSLQFNKGQIVNLGSSTEVKLGLGKLLNLLSLQTIPEALSLHFSNIFGKGYVFDYMKGDFILNKGNILTKNAHFDGPIAKVAIAGRIGFAQKNLDIQLGVSPYVTSSLPLVATAVAGPAGPIAGAVAWAVDKLFIRSAVSKAATYRYHITGSWDHPQWSQAK